MANLIEKIKDKRAPAPETPERRDVPVAHPDPQQGLTGAQVRERADAGWTNAPVDPPGKTVKQIVLSNIFTYFNMLFFLLALCVIAVQQWLNLTFMGVIIVNTAIGIIQEIRSKKTLDKLNILASPKAVAVRDGRRVTIDTAQLVRDDIVIFAAGNQIYADAVVAQDSCYVNEALITGESDEIKKNPGDKLLSGSFVVSGMCRAQLTDVGADSYVSRLTQEAKRAKKPQQSEMMRSLQNLVKWIGILVIPLGVVMFVKEYVWLGRVVPIAVTSTVGSIIGMIPEGLYLLTSLALVAGVVRLAQRKTLVHELGCIETLARVDTLCVDKTGTVTENKMIVEDICPLCDDRFTLEDIRMIMSDYVYAMQADNDTMAALRRYFTGEKTQDATATLPFSSAKKYGGVSFHAEETYLLGAPDVLLAGRENPYQEQIEGYSAKGCRVLLLGMYDGALSDETLSADLLPIALILLSNKIRAEAPETFGYFASQGVAVKVISGDNARTVSEVAKRAGIENADRFVDARTLTTEEAIRAEAQPRAGAQGRRPHRGHDGRRRQRRARAQGGRLLHRHGLGQRRGVPGVAHRAARLQLCLHAVGRGGGPPRHQQHRAQRVAVSGQEHFLVLPRVFHALCHAAVSVQPRAAHARERRDHRHPVVHPRHGAEREPRQGEVFAQRALPRAAGRDDGSGDGRGHSAVLYRLPSRRHGHDHDLHRRHGHCRPHDGAPHVPAVQHHPQGDDRRALRAVRDRVFRLPDALQPAEAESAERAHPHRVRPAVVAGDEGVLPPERPHACQVRGVARGQDREGRVRAA